MYLQNHHRPRNATICPTICSNLHSRVHHPKAQTSSSMTHSVPRHPPLSSRNANAESSRPRISSLGKSGLLSTATVTEVMHLSSRTIRTLPKVNAVSSPVVAKGLTRPRRVEKFMRTSLNLKGDPLKSRTKGWTRKSGVCSLPDMCPHALAENVYLQLT